MKWVRRIGAVSFVFVALLAGFVQFTVSTRMQAIADRGSMESAALINKIVETRDDTVSPAALPEQVLPVENVEDQSDVVDNNSEAPDDSETGAHPQLKRLPTREEIVEHSHFGAEPEGYSGFALQAGIVFESIESIWFGNDGGRACVNGMHLVKHGDLKKGELHIRSGLAEGTQWPELESRALSTLAWLETDPVKAAELLELSIVEGDRGRFEILQNAIKLCEVTGSVELAAYYRERLEREIELENARRERETVR